MGLWREISTRRVEALRGMNKGKRGNVVDGVPNTLILRVYFDDRKMGLIHVGDTRNI